MRPTMRPVLAGLLLAALAAAPVLAADASAPPAPPGQTKPKPDKPGKPDKAAKGPELAITVTGTVEASTDGKGRPEYTITVSGTTWALSAGPKWFAAAASPLKAAVGDSVTVVGTHREGDTDLDVETIDGKAVREDGRPAWAGGPSWVGQQHPGWKAWKLNGKPGRGLGREGAPGQNKPSAEPE